MGIESTPEQLYYSEMAVARFAERELALRQNQLDYVETYVGTTDFPGVRNAQQFISNSESNDVITEPLLGVWLDSVIEAERFPGDEASQNERKRRIYFIGNYVATAAIARQQERALVAMPHQGGIMIPGFGRAIINAPDDEFVILRVGDGIAIESGNTTRHIARANLAEPSEYWQPLRFIGPPGCRIPLDDIHPYRNAFRWRAADRLSDAECAQWHTTFCDALDFIQQHDPAVARIVRASLTAIVPAPPEPFTHGKGMVSNVAFGVLCANEPYDAVRLATHLVFSRRKFLSLALMEKFPDIHLPADDPAAIKPVYPPTREGYGTAAHLLDDSFLNIGLAGFFKSVASRCHPSLQEYAYLSFARWFAESKQNLDGLRTSGYIKDVC